ncbi:hypothetical protein WA158_001458 [Blastocystis sp. Blastoise]
MNQKIDINPPMFKSQVLENGLTTENGFVFHPEVISYEPSQTHEIYAQNQNLVSPIQNNDQPIPIDLSLTQIQTGIQPSSITPVYSNQTRIPDVPMAVVYCPYPDHSVSISNQQTSYLVDHNLLIAGSDHKSATSNILSPNSIDPSSHLSPIDHHNDLTINIKSDEEDEEFRAQLLIVLNLVKCCVAFAVFDIFASLQVYWVFIIFPILGIVGLHNGITNYIIIFGIYKIFQVCSWIAKIIIDLFNSNNEIAYYDLIICVCCFFSALHYGKFIISFHYVPKSKRHCINQKAVHDASCHCF